MYPVNIVDADVLRLEREELWFDAFTAEVLHRVAASPQRHFNQPIVRVAARRVSLVEARSLDTVEAQNLDTGVASQSRSRPFDYADPRTEFDPNLSSFFAFFKRSYVREISHPETRIPLHTGLLTIWTKPIIFLTKCIQEVEWYHPWANLAPTLTQYMDEQDEVLVCGCGNSEMSVDMYDDGEDWPNITHFCCRIIFLAQ